MLYDLKGYVGRSAVFIENSQACVATVESVDCNTDQITAAFRVKPSSFMCRLRSFREADDDPIKCVLERSPFGNTWDIKVSQGEFFLNDDHWQAAFLWGGGFRVFFQPSFVSRFLSGDVGWLEEYFDPETAEDENDA